MKTLMVSIAAVALIAAASPLHAQGYGRPQDGFSSQQYSGQYSGQVSLQYLGRVDGAGAGIKISLQVQATDTIGRIRPQLVRAIAWRSIHSRHPRGRDGTLASVARASEIEPADGSQTKDRPKADVASCERSWIGLNGSIFDANGSTRVL